jgi:hypothetical protein
MKNEINLLFEQKQKISVKIQKIVKTQLPNHENNSENYLPISFPKLRTTSSLLYLKVKKKYNFILIVTAETFG